MRREFSDELLRSLHGFTVALREEVRDVRRMLAARKAETKYNPNWRLQPRAPRGTREGGQWVDGGGTTKPSAPKNRRRGIGDNRPPPETLHEIFPGIPNAPASAILAPLDGFFGLTDPGHAANEQATRNLSESLIAESAASMRAIDHLLSRTAFRAQSKAAISTWTACAWTERSRATRVAATIDLCSQRCSVIYNNKLMQPMRAVFKDCAKTDCQFGSPNARLWATTLINKFAIARASF